MEVILLADVKNVGKKNQTVNVSDGYANNFLLKRKLAVPVSKKSVEILEGNGKAQHRRVAENDIIKKDRQEHQIQVSGRPYSPPQQRAARLMHEDHLHASKVARTRCRGLSAIL